MLFGKGPPFGGSPLISWNEGTSLPQLCRWATGEGTTWSSTVMLGHSLGVGGWLVLQCGEGVYVAVVCLLLLLKNGQSSGSKMYFWILLATPYPHPVLSC